MSCSLPVMYGILYSCSGFTDFNCQMELQKLVHAIRIRGFQPKLPDSTFAISSKLLEIVVMSSLTSTCFHGR
jgi:hypothetical protein